MGEPTPATIRLAVNCPVCRQEVFTEYRKADLVGALINHRPIRLYAPCHDTSWSASYVEVQRIRAQLGATRIDTPRIDSPERGAASESSETSED
jgi:hypothetical protein